jgi:hypothetical protein
VLGFAGIFLGPILAGVALTLLGGMGSVAPGSSPTPAPASDPK